MIRQILVYMAAVCCASQILAIEIKGFRVYQSVDGIYGHVIDRHEDQSFNVNELNKWRNYSTLNYLTFNDIKGQFERKFAQTRSTFWQRKIFRVNESRFVLHLSVPNSPTAESMITYGRKVLVKVGLYCDDGQVLTLGNEPAALVATLQSVLGQVNVYLVVKMTFSTEPSANKLITLDVGPGATKVVLFYVNDEVYIVVTRNVRNECRLHEAGSLIYLWSERKNFKLVQRLTTTEANHASYFKVKNDHYLAVSDLNSEHDLGEGRVLLYRYQSVGGVSCGFARFKLFQKLAFKATVELVVFSVGSTNKESVYMAAVNDKAIQVWRQNTGNLTGFSHHWSMATLNAVALKPLLEKNKLFLIVAKTRPSRGSMVLIGSTGHFRRSRMHLIEASGSGSVAFR